MLRSMEVVVGSGTQCAEINVVKSSNEYNCREGNIGGELHSGMLLKKEEILLKISEPPKKGLVCEVFVRFKPRLVDENVERIQETQIGDATRSRLRIPHQDFLPLNPGTIGEASTLSYCCFMSS